VPLISDTLTMSRRSRLRPLVARIQRRLEGEEGFTLVELTIVLLILGILLSIAVPSYLTFKDNAAKTAAKQNVAQVIRDIAAYGADNYPGSPNDPDPSFAGSPSGANDSGYNGLSLVFLQTKYDPAVSIVVGAPYVINPAGFTPTPTDFCLTATVGRWTAAKRGIDGPVSVGISFDDPINCVVH